MTAATRTWQPYTTLLLVVAIVVATLLLVLSTQRGWWVLDNKFLLYWDPARGLRDNFTTWLSGRDLGATRQGFSPATFAYVSLLRALGASPWLAERLFHATLISAGGLGVAAICRAFKPDARIGALLAGLWWVTSPFTVAFLMPSWLYLQAVIGVWLLYATYRGVSSRSYWKWSAVFALLVFVAGSLNLPGLFFAALPVVPLLVYLLITRQVVAGRIAQFSLRALVLTAIVYLPSIVQLAAGSQVLYRNLLVTESAATVSASSSWPESFRGLGGWLLYFKLPGRASLDYVQVFFRNPLVLVLTVLPLLMAIWVIGWSRWRFRVLFGLILLTSAIAMVGAFPFAGPPPWGKMLLRVYEWFPSMFSLRNTYKAGPGVVVAVGVLAGVGVENFYRRFGNRSAGRAGVILAALLVLLASSSPFWTGGVYGSSSSRVYEVPGYWFEATRWLDDQPDATRALVLPDARVPAYTWGTPGGGDIFPSLLRRTFMLNEALPSGIPTSSNVVSALSLQLSKGRFSPGALAPVAARLGIGYIVIRNDLVPEVAGSVKPSSLDAVRRDPSLTLAAVFGEPGQNVLGDDSDLTAARTPVEIYRVRGVEDTLQVVPSDGSVVVSGDGEAWLGLADSGPLTGSAPVQYSGQLDRQELLTSLNEGSSIWITDTNRRRSPALYNLSGLTLPASTVGFDLFGNPSTQSVATYGDVSRIETVNAKSMSDANSSQRPAAATDGDRSSAWLTGSGLPFSPQGLRFDLDRPTEISQVNVVRASSSGRRVSGAVLVVPDGRVIPFEFDGDTGTASIPPVALPWFEVIISGVSGSGLGGFGIAEIEVKGLDMREVIQVPTDVADAAIDDPEIGSILKSTEYGFLFTRMYGEGVSLENTLRRKFLLPVDRNFATDGSLRASPMASDADLAVLIRPQTVALADARSSDALSGTGLYAADGDLATGWSVPAVDRPRLDVLIPQQSLRSVNIILDVSAASVSSVEVSVPSGATSSVTTLPSCRQVNASCLTVVSIPLVATTNRFSITVNRTDLNGANPSVVEVQPNGVANAPFPTRLSTVCFDRAMKIDGVPTSIVIEGTTSALLSGDSLRYRACGPQNLSSGWHRLDSADSFVLDRVRMTSPGRHPQDVVAAGVISVTNRSSTATSATVDAPSGGWLIGGAAATPAWRATSDGDVMRAATMNLQAAFLLPKGTSRIGLQYEPQRIFVPLVVLSMMGLAGCIALVVLDPKQRGQRIRELEPKPLPHIAPVVVRIAFVFGSAAIGGLAGAIVAIGLVVLLSRRWLSVRSVLAVALLLVSVSFALYFPPLGPGLKNVSVGWVSRRWMSNSVGRVAALFIAGGVFELLIMQMRQGGSSSSSASPQPPESATTSRDGARSSTTSDQVRK